MLIRTPVRLVTFCVMLALIGHSAVAKPGRAVSLNILAAAMKTGQLTDQAESLCGITRLTGYVIDRKSRDIVLVGAVDPSLPPLHLEDLVVAMRNAWIVYGKTKGGIRYYSDPGCSIDPDPRVLCELHALQAEPIDFSNDDALRAASDKWNEIGRRPQSVRVMGVPFDSQFARTMVDADYYMKRLVNGSVKLGIDGFRSLSDLHADARREQMRTHTESDEPQTSMNRFWFSPGEVTYEQQDSAVVLRSCTVKLLTEEEFLNSKGGISGMGRPDALAGTFARQFTECYDEIALQRPIYRQLQGLFAFVAIARLMKEGGAAKVAPGAFDYLLKTYKVPVAPVNRKVNGLTCISRVEEVLDTGRGKRTIVMIQSSCGGVSMSVHPKRVGPAKATTAPTVAASRASSPAVGTTSAPKQSHPATSATSRPAHPSRTVAAKPAPKPAPRPSMASTVLGARKSPRSLAWDVQVDVD